MPDNDSLWHLISLCDSWDTALSTTCDGRTQLITSAMIKSKMLQSQECVANYGEFGEVFLFLEWK